MKTCPMTLLEAAKVFVKRVDDCVPTIFFFEYQKEYNNLCAAIAEHEQELKADGWRRCAEGQGETQHCALLEAAVLAEREACARICDDHADDPVYCGQAIRVRGEK